MARRFSNLHFGSLLLAMAIAVFLWGIANGTRDIERGFNIAVEIHGVSDSLVVTDQSADDINVRVAGSRAALNNLNPAKLQYLVDVSDQKSGVGEYEVELSRIDLPRNIEPRSHSPSRIQIRMERRGRKAVGVRADVEGKPAPGYRLVAVRVLPGRVWVVGARSHVMRLSEILTEPVDVSGLTESQQREVRPIIGGGTVWLEEDKPITLHIDIEPAPESEENAAIGGGPARVGGASARQDHRRDRRG
jgi:YbbR domain-containing protein